MRNIKCQHLNKIKSKIMLKQKKSTHISSLQKSWMIKSHLTYHKNRKSLWRKWVSWRSRQSCWRCKMTSYCNSKRIWGYRPSWIKWNWRISTWLLRQKMLKWLPIWLKCGHRIPKPCKQGLHRVSILIHKIMLKIHNNKWLAGQHSNRTSLSRTTHKQTEL